MIERYILELLQKAVTANVAGTDAPPVKMLGRNFKVPASGKWWEVIYIPNNRPNEFWSEGKTYQGILRLILHWPQNDEGIYKAMDEVKRVADRFEKGTIYNNATQGVRVVLTDNADITSIIEQPPENLIPLTIRYNCFKI